MDTIVSPDWAQIGHLYDGASFLLPPISPAAEKERALFDADLPPAACDLLARRAALRQQIAGG